MSNCLVNIRYFQVSRVKSLFAPSVVCQNVLFPCQKVFFTLSKSIISVSTSVFLIFYLVKKCYFHVNKCFSNVIVTFSYIPKFLYSCLPFFVVHVWCRLVLCCGLAGLIPCLAVSCVVVCHVLSCGLSTSTYLSSLSLSL